MAGGEGTQRETWQDWLPPERHDPRPLLTRAQLVGQLQSAGVKVEEGDLRYWEYEGILPRTVRQRHEGATRAVYPRWYPALVAALRAFQSAGYELRVIGDMVRALFQEAGPHMPPAQFLSPPFLQRLSYHLHEGGQAPGLAVMPPELGAAILEFAKRNWHIYGTGALRRGEIRFYGDGPEPIVYPFDLAVDEDPHGQSGDVTLARLPVSES